MKTLRIEEKNARRLYSSASSEFKAMLEDTFGNDFFNKKITDRIKSYEDACEVLGYEPVNEGILTRLVFYEDEIAYRKLKTIAKALNEGWEPDWSNHEQYKYYGYLYTDTTGFVSAYTDFTAASAPVGSRICFKNRELTLYAITQFKTLYEEYFFIK
ncbi:MAG: hypothetical protein LBL18_00425 [Bacteroidales bacterium]|nr:hypothetical protein [Bacteroidales bacterium]